MSKFILNALVGAACIFGASAQNTFVDDVSDLQTLQLPPGAGDGIFVSSKENNCPEAGWTMTVRANTITGVKPDALGSGGQQRAAPGVITAPTFAGHGSMFVWNSDHWMEFDYARKVFTCNWMRPPPPTE